MDLMAEVAENWGTSDEAVALTTAAASAQQAIVVWVNDAFLRLTGFSRERDAAGIVTHYLVVQSKL